MTMSHRPGREGEPARDGHVPAYLAAEYLTEAYHLALAHWCGRVVTPHEMAIVHLDADFQREVFVGVAEFEVDLTRLGRTSITLAITLRQSGADAVAARMVLAHVAEGRSGSSPFADGQRALLEAALAPADRR
jgi:acyl-CoA thioesterase FadM